MAPRNSFAQLSNGTSMQAMGRVATAAPVPADSTLTLDAKGVWRKFPSLHDGQLLAFGWRQLAAASRDTVHVIWAVAAVSE